MAVKPIRLFGDPVLRHPGRAGRRPSTRSCASWSRTSPTRCSSAPGAGLAAPQLGVGLRVFTYDVDDEIGHLINPVLDLSDEEQERRRGLPVGPRPRLRHPARDARRRQGHQHARRAGDHRGHRAAGPVRPARDRPPRRDPVHRPARHRDPQGGHEGHPRGRVVRRSPAPGQGQPAPHRVSARLAVRCGSSSPAPPRPPSRRCARCSSPTARGRRRGHPAGRPVRSRPHAARRRRSATLAAEHGIEVLKPDASARPRVPRRLRELAPDCCPVVAYGALRAARGARRSRATAGSTCTSRCCPAWRGAAPGAARDRGRRRRHRGDDLPARGGARHRAGVRRRHRDHRARPTPAATCSAASPSPVPGCWSRRSTGIEDGDARRRAATVRRRLAGAQDHRRRRRGSTGPSPRVRSTARSARARRRPGAWTTYGDERLKLGPVTLRPTTPRWRPASSASTRTGCWSAPRSHAGRLGEVQPQGKKAMAAADWARGARPADRRPRSGR